MSITTETNRLAFVGDGSDNSPYAISFPLRDDDSIQVIYVTDATGAEVIKTKTTDYTIALAADFVTANLTLVTTAPATGETMVIIRDEPATRLSNYSNFDGQPAATLNADYDKGTMQDLTLQEQVDRAVLVSKGHPNASLPLTPLILKGNADKSIIVNSGETDFELVSVADIAIGDGTIVPAKLLDGSANNQIIQYNDGLGEWEYRSNLTVDGDITANTGNVKSTKASGTANLIATNTSAGAATVSISTQTGSLDPSIAWQINPAGQAYTMGIDNSDSDKWVLARGSVLGTTNIIEVDASGAVTFPTVALTIFAGNINVNSDSDGTAVLGRVKVGTVLADIASFGHFDHFTLTNAALRQNNLGTTIVGAATGRLIELRVNNVLAVAISSISVTLQSSVNLTLAAGNATVNGLLTVNSNADGTTILGRAKIGSTTSDLAIFAHFDNFTATNYAVKQTSLGSTTINAATGEGVDIAINANTVFGCDSTLVTIPDNDLVVTLGDLHVTAGVVSIGIASGDGTLHVHSGSAGTVVAAVGADDIVIEGSGLTGISILTPGGANDANIFFGEEADNSIGKVVYKFDDASGGVMLFTVENVRVVSMNGNAVFIVGASAAATNIGAQNLQIQGGVLATNETTTPTADATIAKWYSKSDNKAYIQTGDGVEHELAFV